MIPADETAMTCGTVSTAAMTIGGLARRTGVPVKTLREYEDLGLIYTVGRSLVVEYAWCAVRGTIAISPRST